LLNLVTVEPNEFDESRLSEKRRDMSLSSNPSWPEFKIVQLGLPRNAQPPTAGQGVISVPVGLIGFEYRALDAVEKFTAGSADLLAFGSCGLFGRICLHPATGEVVHAPIAGSASANHVNRDLGAFRSCVAAVIDRFPFYGEGAELDEQTEVADDIRDILQRIDDSALRNNGFWETFCDDITIGDYSTEGVIE
jgi:hypothetical protein